MVLLKKKEYMTQDIPLKDLVLLEKNPRKITKEQMEKLCNSLESDPAFLEKRPILVNKVEGKYHVYAGNQRIRAAKKLKWKTVPCSIDENLDEKTVKERIIKDNQTFGEFDYDILANEWDTDLLLEAGMTEDQLGYDPIETILGEEEDQQTLSPGEDKDAQTKLGDIYELNDHKLICGDSTNPDCVSKLLEDKQSIIPHEPILMVTDPPYGVNYDPKWRCVAGKGVRSLGKVQNDDKVNWALAWHLFPGNVAYVWHSLFFTSEVQKSLIDAEFEIVSEIIWVKQHFALSRGDYHAQHEACWYAVRKGQKHNWQGSRKETTVWEISNLNAFGKSQDEDERTSHSTQKPLECMSKPIRNNTCAGEGVYDPFIGSGTTLIACEQLKRNCYGIELSPAYCDIVIGRWIKYMKKNNRQFKIKRNDEEIQWQADQNPT